MTTAAMAFLHVAITLVLVWTVALAEIRHQNTTVQAGIPVYVMLPLSLVSNDGDVIDAPGLRNQLSTIRSTGAAGVMLDVWWGLVERAPKSYRWVPYLDIASLVQEVGLRMQVIMSFHRCGGNIGDSCNISLPSWLPRADNWGYVDRQGQVNPEYISLFYDNVSLASGNTSRTPLQMYEDYMVSFAETFESYLTPVAGVPATISTVEVGLGPCGELRYPSYVMSVWQFPGIGEFQCYDEQSLASLAHAARTIGRPDWGHPPDDAGSYSNLPVDAPFFQPLGKYSFDSDYGSFFLAWYSGALIAHGRAVLSRAKAAFARIPGVQLDAKVAGIHWHYGHPSHAAELTAGYYNLAPDPLRNGYLDIARMFSEFDAGFCFTCLEMLDREQTVPGSASKPEELVQQTKEAAYAAGVAYAGENALERYDATAYGTIVAQSTAKFTLRSFTYLRLGDTLLRPENLGEFTEFVKQMAAVSAATAEPVAQATQATQATQVTQAAFQGVTGAGEVPPPRRAAAVLV